MQERLAEQLHEWYLEATHKLRFESFNPKAQKPYSELTDEQRFIDKYIADRILQLFRDEVVPKKYDFDGKHQQWCYVNIGESCNCDLHNRGYNQAIDNILEKLEE
jgi:hypothetical protein